MNEALGFLILVRSMAACREHLGGCTPLNGLVGLAIMLNPDVCGVMSVNQTIVLVPVSLRYTFAGHNVVDLNYGVCYQ